MAKPKQSKPHRSTSQEEADRRNVARLYLSGRLQSEIAEELGISQTTVSRDIKYLTDEWKQERVYDINEAKARELAKIDNLELIYFDAWERSRKNAGVKTKKEIKIGIDLNPSQIATLSAILPAEVVKSISQGVTRQEIQERIEGQIGDPRYLSGIQWCIEQRCRILGVEAPKKIEGGEEPLDVRIIEVVKSYERGEKPSK